MANLTLDIIDIKSNQVTGSFEFLAELSAELLEHNIYLVNKYQKNWERRGTASTKTRSEVSGGGAKPYKQKGTGRARRGTQRTPLRPGGGIIFGPKPRSYVHKLNKNLIKKSVLNALLSRKEVIKIFSDCDSIIKTKLVKSVLDSQSIQSSHSVLIILTSLDDKLFRSVRNLRNVDFCFVNNIPIARLLASDAVFLTEASAKALKSQFESLTRGEEL